MLENREREALDERRVEAVAKDLWSQFRSLVEDRPPPWEQADEWSKRHYGHRARRVLSAADQAVPEDKRPENTTDRSSTPETIRQHRQAVPERDELERHPLYRVKGDGTVERVDVERDELLSEAWQALHDLANWENWQDGDPRVIARNMAARLSSKLDREERSDG